MKYIKYFESENLYKRIEIPNNNDFNNPNEWADFTLKEIEEIKLIDSEFKPGAIYNIKYKDQVLSNKNDKIIIYKLKDEWFYVLKNHFIRNKRKTVYKCDQFEGLIQCIKDII